MACLCSIFYFVFARTGNNGVIVMPWINLYCLVAYYSAYMFCCKLFMQVWLSLICMSNCLSFGLTDQSVCLSCCNCCKEIAKKRWMRICTCTCICTQAQAHCTQKLTSILFSFTSSNTHVYIYYSTIVSHFHVVLYCICL